MERISICLLLIRKCNIFLLEELARLTLAAVIVPMRLLEKLDAKRRRLEATCTGHMKILWFLSLEFLSQNTNTRMLFRNVATYV